MRVRHGVRPPSHVKRYAGVSNPCSRSDRCLTSHGGSRIIGRMTTAIIHHPVFEQHDTGPGHPESPERYSVVMQALRGDAELWPRLLEVEAGTAPRGDVQAAHTPQHFKHVERAVSEGLG